MTKAKFEYLRCKSGCWVALGPGQNRNSENDIADDLTGSGANN